MVDAGFEAAPVMLENGAVVDRSLLPRNAVPEHAIAMSADDLLQSVASSQRDMAQGHAITFSGMLCPP